MNRLLHGILSGQAGLKLSQFETLPASCRGQGLEVGGCHAQAWGGLVVTGPYADYADGIAYPARLTKVPERIFWGNLEMTAEYPLTALGNATVYLQSGKIMVVAVRLVLVCLFTAILLA